LSSQPFKTIAPPKKFPLPNVVELWHYRYLAFYLAWRDVKARFQQTILGPLWPLVEPIMLMLVFTFVFGTIAEMPSDGVPYPLFTFSALVPWTLFANGLTRMTTSLTSNANLITKISFPRLLLPLSSLLATLFEFLVSLAVLFALMLAFGYPLTLRVLALVPLTLLGMLATVGLGVAFAAMNARFRDVGNGVGILLRVLLYLTPVAYASSVLPAPWNTLYALNPIAGVIDGFRWALLGGEMAASALVSSVGVSLVLVVLGVLFFLKSDADLADVV
jgi:lipopolysaccharide transport system permease protein